MSTVDQGITRQNNPVSPGKPAGAALVSVGIPTFNRPDGLDRTLSCITAQSYPWLEIIVSDNGSPDPRVAAVAERYALTDSRVHYFRQDSNKGPYFNFQFVLDRATGTYFMWMADDDTREPDFIEEMVRLLDSDLSVGLAFCAFDALDSQGSRIDTYPDFLPLLQQFTAPDTKSRLRNYLRQEEASGKAVVVYGLYRKRVIEEAKGIRSWGLGYWGSDMLSVFRVLSLARLALSERLLLHVGPALPTTTPHVLGTQSNRGVWELVRLSVGTLMGHWGYVLGYVNLIARARSLSLFDRLTFLPAISSKFLRLTLQDLRPAIARVIRLAR